MKQSIAQFTIMFIMFYAHAMEVVKKDPSVPHDDICHLQKMPRDILDYIASFLMETEQEFVERTFVKKKIKKEYRNFLFNLGFYPLYTALCPDGTKALLWVRPLKTPEVTINNDEIMIVNRKKDSDEKSIMHQQKFDHKRVYGFIGLSQTCNMMARVYAIEEGEHVDYCNYSIRIEKIITQKTRDIFLDSRMVPESIFFNKQGTHVIVHGRNSSGENVHKVYPLKIVDSKKPHVIMPTTNKLQEYLRDRFVCNNYIEGKK